MRLPDPTARCGRRSALLTLVLLGVAQAQSPDLDLRSLATTTVAPNDRSGARPAFVVSTKLAPWSGRIHVEDAGGTPCDLIVRAGGQLSIERSHVELVGDLILEQGGTLRIVDSTFLLRLGQPSQFIYLWRGGWLDTLRTTIGGWEARSYTTGLKLKNGLWTARDTTIVGSGGILIGETAAPLAEQGGTLIADGLFSGRIGDFVHMQGRGNATLRNSNVGISLRLLDPGPTSSNIPIDVGDVVIARRVYGDAAFHDAVTHHIPNCAFRLELENCSVNQWNLQFREAGAGRNPRTYELSGEARLTIHVAGDDITGSPVLLGPWRSFYPGLDPLPGLPSANYPGYHRIPPGCGVRIGAVSIVAPPGSWTKALFWTLHLNGNATNFTVTGPSRLSEILVGGGTLTLAGARGYDMGVSATGLLAHSTGTIVVRGAMVGTDATQQGDANATGYGAIVMEDCKVRRLLLRTSGQTILPPLGLDLGTAVMRRFVPSCEPTETLTTRMNRLGSVTVEVASASQSTDLQNLDFERGVQGNGSPSYWTGTGMTGLTSTQLRPGAATGQLASFEYRSAAAGGEIRKTITAPEDARFEWHGHVRVLASGGGETLEFAIEGGGNRRSAVSVPVVPGAWTSFHVPQYAVAPGDAAIAFVVRHTGASGASLRLLLDDFTICAASFWEDDNLVNLDFEELLLRSMPSEPDGNLAPDYWSVVNCAAALETADRPPGSLGQRAARLSVFGPTGTIKKRLRFVAPGQIVTVTGKAKAISGPGNPTSFFYVYVGEGTRFWDSTYGTNVQQRFSSGTGWNSFSIAYTVPSPPTKLEYTTFAVAGALTGDTILVDDFTVTVR